MEIIPEKYSCQGKGSLPMELKKKEKSVVNYPTLLGAGIILGTGLIITACSGSEKKSDANSDKKVEDSKKSKTEIKSELDSDGDGIPDKVDKCPAVKGTARYHGCTPQDKVKLSGVARRTNEVPPPPPVQDTDGDGIADKDDKCPKEKGTAEFNGCPPPVRKLGLQVPVKK